MKAERHCLSLSKEAQYVGHCELLVAKPVAEIA